MRRAGKSYAMKLMWQRIRADEDLPDAQACYVNFEHEKMLAFRADDFETPLESYHELFAPNPAKRIYLFFDEIQVAAGWEKFVNRVLADGKYKIFITGSNATLLSREIGTALTGRQYPVSLFPLSFREFVA